MLDVVWRDPENLPTLGELDDARAWIDRVDAAASPADGLGTAPALAPFVAAARRARRRRRPRHRRVFGWRGLARVARARARIGSRRRARCTSITACAPARTTPTSSRRAAARFGADFRTSCASTSPPAATSKRARATPGTPRSKRSRAEQRRRRDPRRPHARRPGRDRAAEPAPRGSATSGLAGMPARRGAPAAAAARVPPAETREICARLGLAPVQDPMNDDVRYRRVWLRREVIPQLERDARRDLVDVLARQADAVARRRRATSTARPRRCSSPDAAQDAGRLAAAPVALARRAVRSWLGAPPPSLDQVDAVLAVARGERRAVAAPR